MVSSLLGDKAGMRVFFEYFGMSVLGYWTVVALMRLVNNVGTFFLGIGSLNLKSYGAWAVVTGCTDGIGKAYVEQFAKRGLNIVLISRTLDKLNAQADELKRKYNIQTLVIAADFTEQSSIYAEIKAKIGELDIGVLVNNVGMSYSHPEYFDIFAQSERSVADMINCNVTSVTKMTAIVLPGMAKKRKGVIINNGSASGRLPTPLLAVYSASKAYVDIFSRALSIEYASKGIVVQSLCPYYVSTKLSKLRASMLILSPQAYVSSALKTIGSQPVTNGCISHNTLGWLLEDVLPRWLTDKVQWSELSGVRARALKKLQRKQLDEQKKE